MDTLLLAPSLQICIPGLARSCPIVTTPMQPSSRLGWSETIEAPFRRRSVESLPRPFDDDEHPIGVKRGGDLPDDLAGIFHVVKRVTGHHGIDRVDRLILLEPDLFKAKASRRDGIKPCGLIADGLQHGDETTRCSTADFEHPSRSNWQVNSDQRPKRYQSSFLGRHNQLYCRGLYPSDARSSTSGMVTL